jgi:hypothetical protein
MSRANNRIVRLQPQCQNSSCIMRAEEDPIMDPIITKTGTTGTGQTATTGQSLSQQGNVNTAATPRGRGAPQEIVEVSGATDQTNQQTGYGNKGTTNAN